jgi:hypothetical protein
MPNPHSLRNWSSVGAGFCSPGNKGLDDNKSSSPPKTESPFHGESTAGSHCLWVTSRPPSVEVPKKGYERTKMKIKNKEYRRAGCRWSGVPCLAWGLCELGGESVMIIISVQYVMDDGYTQSVGRSLVAAGEWMEYC